MQGLLSCLLCWKFKISLSLPVKNLLRSCNSLNFCKQSLFDARAPQYVQDMYNAWVNNPASVHVSWDVFFRKVASIGGGRRPHVIQSPSKIDSSNVNSIESNLTEFQQIPKTMQDIFKNSQVNKILSFATQIPPSGGGGGGDKGGSSSDGPGDGKDSSEPPKLPDKVNIPEEQIKKKPKKRKPKPSQAVDSKDIQEYLAVQAIIRSFQVRGYIIARVNPLGPMFQDRTSVISDEEGKHPDRITRQHRYDNEMMARYFKLPITTFIGGDEDSELTFTEILRRLEFAYCRHIGPQYMHIDSFEQQQWIRKRFEPPGVTENPPEVRKRALERLIRSTQFAKFLSTKFSADKRYGLEGAEVVVPVINQIIDTSVEMGVDSFIIGMGSQGRINVLANVCRKPVVKILTHFVASEPEDVVCGDLKFNLGTTTEILNRAHNKKISLALLANPCHEECVSPVALGKTRAEQLFKGDSEGKATLCILIHSDLSFSGQGIVFETLQMSNLSAFTAFGTIHVIINSQLGFTNDPRDYTESAANITDVARVVDAPIFHVNGDDVDDCIHCSKVAAEWRAKYHKDVVVDVVCYRRHGWPATELYDPMFTKPHMYTKIKTLPNVLDRYTDTLIKDGVATEEDIKEATDDFNKLLDAALAEAAKVKSVKMKDWVDSDWSDLYKDKDPYEEKTTGVKEDILKTIGKTFSSPPPSSAEFVVHPAILKLFQTRLKLLKRGAFEFSMAEAFAFGSLMKEGYPIRFTGERVETGTFDHRHHVLHHQVEENQVYQQLNNLFPDQAPYLIHNSALSEYGAMAFELGFAKHNPNLLVIWEGKYGDFFNNAQVLLDTYVSSGEDKWGVQVGLVLMLPHGYEGMGPEYSSARVERFLQMCNDDADKLPEFSKDTAMRQLYACNWIVANPTTPANLFHVLRRQMAMNFRKPLVLLTPKGLLYHPQSVSNMHEVIEGTFFKRIIPDSRVKDASKVIFCSGKVYYDLVDSRHQQDMQNEVAIIRLEQVSPFPYDLLKPELDKYSTAKVLWVQEEPKNQGPWPYVHLRFKTLLQGRDIHYVGRPVSASPATGFKYRHIEQLALFLEEAFSK